MALAEGIETRIFFGYLDDKQNHKNRFIKKLDYKEPSKK